MNRIHTTPPVEGEVNSSSLDSQTLSFTPLAHDTSHSLFAPLHYEAKYAYPLIVWLHGPGTVGERELLEIMPVISLRNYVAVAPQGFRTREGESEPCWFDWPQSEGHIEETERRVFHAIDAACHKCNVARRRIFVAGFGSGGTMAFRVAMDHPDRFTGVLSLCGGFPRGRNPLAQLTLARRLPLFLAFGRDSLEYPPRRACDDLRLFHAAGMSVALRQYPCGHQRADQMLRDMDRWIINEITSAGDPPAEAGDLWARSSD